MAASGPVEEELHTRETAGAFHLFLLETAPQFGSTEAKNEVKSISKLVFEVNFHEGPLRPHVREADDCKHI